MEHATFNPNQTPAIVPLSNQKKTNLDLWLASFLLGAITFAGALFFTLSSDPLLSSYGIAGLMTNR